VDTLRSGEWIVEKLVDIVSKGGNFMVGVGPDNTGAWDPAVLERLEYAGNWLEKNGEGIFATRPWKEYREGENIRFTCSKDGTILYAHSIGWPGKEFRSGLVKPARGSQVSMLGVEDPLRWKIRGGELVVNIPDDLQEEGNRPCRQVYVFKIRLK
jgi:alpha-L-fucosidase